MTVLYTFPEYYIDTGSLIRDAVLANLGTNDPYTPIIDEEARIRTPGSSTEQLNAQIVKLNDKQTDDASVVVGNDKNKHETELVKTYVQPQKAPLRRKKRNKKKKSKTCQGGQCSA